MSPLDLVTAISQAVKEVTSLTRELVSSAEVRRLRYRVEAAVNYIFVDEKSGEYANIRDKERDGLKRHFRKRVFDEA